MGRAWGPCPRQDGEEASDWELFPSPQPSQVTQMVKSLPAVRETQVGSLGQEGPLEEEMATHSSVLAWKIPWMEEPGSLQSTGSQRVNTTKRLPFSLPQPWVCH